MPVLEFLFNKVAVLQASNFIKKRLQHKCYPVKFVKFLRTAFFTEHLDDDMQVDPVTSHNRAEIDHIRLVFFPN